MRDPATTPSESDGLFDGLNFPAIAHGVFVDIFSTLVGQTLFILILGGGDVFTTDSAAADAALDSIAGTNAYLVGMLVIGALATVFGAYRGARRAGAHHVRHGGWVAVSGTLLIALLSTACAGEAGVEPSPLWTDIVSWLLIIPSGVAGGLIAEARQE